MVIARPLRLLPALVTALVLSLAPAPSSLEARTPLGGLAVAADPAGKRLFAAGDSRTLYELDPATLEVKRRHWLGTTVVGLAVSNDGKTLLVEDTAPSVRWLDAETFEETRRLEDTGQMHVQPRASLIAVVQGRREKAVKVLQMVSATVRHSAPLTKGERVVGLALDPAGAQLAILSFGASKGDEARAPSSEQPPDVKGIALDTWRQKNDGKMSRIRRIDFASGKAVYDKGTWYRASGESTLLFRASELFVIAYGNVNARFDAAGEATLFRLGSGFNYGAAANAEGTVIVAGGLRKGVRVVVPALEEQTYQLDTLEGWPEYYESFCVVDDGTSFAGTSGYRVARIGPDGMLVKVAGVR